MMIKYVMDAPSREPTQNKKGSVKVKRNTRYIDKLLAIQECSALEANEIGFIARFLIQATLPHSNPGLNEWCRKNGNLTMHMMAPSAVGLPFGCYARLLLVWVSSQAVRNKSKLDKGFITEQEARKLELGRSQRRFMEDLGLRSTGGKNGSINPFREQMRRLFKTTVSVTFAELNEESGYVCEDEMGARVADVSHILWRAKQPEKDFLWESWVELSPKFFQLITDKPVPLDMRVLRLIKRSPMALDIYCWATYRVSYLKRGTIIPWLGLMEQMGSNYSDVRDFRRRFNDGLEKVQRAWPGLDATPTDKGLLIKPGAPQVPRRKKYRTEGY
ncbi:pirin [Salmonella enterica]|nr:pirin [Salmonella enterica]ELF7275528.1 pirin [Salmonella enterica]